MRPFTFFLNESARKVKTLELAPKLSAWAQAKSIDLAFASPSLDGLGAAVRNALDLGRVPVAVGGDGSVHQLAQHMPSATPFGTLPLGSGNDFATALGWSGTLEKALDQLLTARAVRLDCLSVEQDSERKFKALSVAGWGFACDVNREANASRIPGALQYPAGIFQALSKGGTRRVRLTFDDEHVVEGPFWTLMICNTALAGGGMKFAPGAHPQDGLMEVLALGDVSTLGLMGLLARVYFGRHLSHDRVKLWSCRTLKLEPLEETDGQLSDVLAEGDMYAGAQATTFRVLPRDLSVLVPKDSILTDGTTGDAG